MAISELGVVVGQMEALILAFLGAAFKIPH